MSLARRGFVQAALGAGLARAAHAQTEPRFFRIGTGGVAGTYYQVGAIIATAISSPPGARPCDRGGSCGVPGLVAIVQSSGGSVENLRLVLDGSLESGFAQADVLDLAARGEGPFAGAPAAAGLRAIAALYVESLHVVVRRSAGVASIADLRGKRVAVDTPGSGSAVVARAVLRAAALDEGAVDAREIPPTDALDAFSSGEIDAFLLVAGYPTPAVEEALRDLDGMLVPLDEPVIEAMVRESPFLRVELIPFRTYGDEPAVATVGVPAVWVVRTTEDAELVHGITAALFHPTSRELFLNAHPRARDIRAAQAFEGLPLPLHPGAERWYREQGLLR